MKSFVLIAISILVVLIGVEVYFLKSPKSSAKTKPSATLLAAQVSGDSDSGHSTLPSTYTGFASPAASSSTGPVSTHLSLTAMTLSAPNTSRAGISVDPRFLAQASATCRIGNKKYPLQANAMGWFPQIDIDARQKIALSVRYPGGVPGQKVNVQVADGGGLGNDYQMAIQESLDGTGAFNFNFQAGSEEGIYRVILDNDGMIQTFRFWVGLDPPQRGLAAAK